jgi:hypothetical protein
VAETWTPGSGWRLRAVPVPAGTTLAELSGVSCPESSSCTAVGGYLDGSGLAQPLVETWNGKVWTIVTAPDPATQAVLDAVACAAPATCKSVGLSLGPAGVLPLFESWDGAGWTVDTVPEDPNVSSPMFRSIACPAVTACTAVGFGRDVAGVSVGIAERWDGSAWSSEEMPSPAPDNDIGVDTIAFPSGVTCSTADDCVAVGEYFGLSGPWTFAVTRS